MTTKSQASLGEISKYRNENIQSHIESNKEGSMVDAIKKITPAHLSQMLDYKAQLGDALEGADAESAQIINQLKTRYDFFIQLLMENVVNIIIKDNTLSQVLASDINNSENELISISADPNSKLNPKDKLGDEVSKQIFSDFIKERIKENIIKGWDQFTQDIQPISDTDTYQKSVDYVNELISDAQLVDRIKILLTDKLIQGVAPELTTFNDEFSMEMRKAIQEKDIEYDILSKKNKLNDMIDKLSNIVTVDQVDVTVIQQEFENKCNHLTNELVVSVIKAKLEPLLDDCKNKADINKIKTSDLYKNIEEKIDIINDEDLKNQATECLTNVMKFATLAIDSALPQIRKHEDYVNFDGVNFPVFHAPIKPKVTANRKLEVSESTKADKLDIGFTEVKSKTPLSVDTKNKLKKLRITEKELEDIESKSKDSVKLLKQKDELLTQLAQARKDKNTEEINKIEGNLKEVWSQIDKEVPHVTQVLHTLRKLPLPQDLYSAKNLGVVPDFNPEKIKVTPDTMDTVQKLLHSIESQLVRQDGITILEGEAGVGKNVNIDLIGHYTNRPVFTFACSPKTDREDITYQWTLTEKGTQKLNSIVYEAIMTPGAIIVFDEINTLEEGVAKQLNALFDYRRSLKMAHVNGEEKADQSVILLGTMNPVGYAGVQDLPQDVKSRSDIINQDYESNIEFENTNNQTHFDYSNLIKSYGEGVTIPYGEAIKMISNIPFFWKLQSYKGISKDQITQWKEAKLKKLHDIPLSIEEEQLLSNITNPVSDKEFVYIRNEVFNKNNESEIISKYGEKFVEGLKDIYALVVYANYIRIRYKSEKQGWEEDKLAREGDDAIGSFSVSASPRILFNMLKRVHDGLDPKTAFIDVYTMQISNVTQREKVKNLLNNKDFDDMQEEIYKTIKKFNNIDDLNDNDD